MIKYYVMVPHRDEYGARFWIRDNMRNVHLSTARRMADAKPGSYVCKVGTTDPVYVS